MRITRIIICPGHILVKVDTDVIDLVEGIFQSSKLIALHGVFANGVQIS